MKAMWYFFACSGSQELTLFVHSTCLLRQVILRDQHHLAAQVTRDSDQQTGIGDHYQHTQFATSNVQGDCTQKIITFMHQLLKHDKTFSSSTPAGCVSNWGSVPHTTVPAQDATKHLKQQKAQTIIKKSEHDTGTRQTGNKVCWTAWVKTRILSLRRFLYQNTVLGNVQIQKQTAPGIQSSR